MGTVVFDCDSTLSTIEGIEYLARSNPEVERLTRAAMDGDVPLEAVYGRRLALVRPGREALRQLAAAYVEALVPDARAVIAALRSEGMRVCVVSGGLLPAVQFLALELGLDAVDVGAVDVFFAPDGSYAGYDEHSPLARRGGKRELLESWRRELPAPIMLVGDGATDAEARPVVDALVAYCGVVERPAVVAAADHVIRDASLSPVLPLALGGAQPRSADYQAVYEKGVSLLAAGERRRTQPEPESQRV